MSKPTVAIVGRPNVGKSTLFNRILGGRPAIVSERPGTTRDRHFGDAEWQGRRVWLVDPGGLIPGSHDTMDRAIEKQVEFALAESDVIIFVTDGREGLHPLDQAIAERLRRAARPVLLAVNKLEEKLVPVDGDIEVRKRMNLSLSCDHRVVDGWDAASFMQALKAYIENPLRLLSA